MMIRKILTTATCICLLFAASAQVKIPAELRDIQKQLQLSGAMTYDYTMEQRLQDGTVNKIKGKVIRGKDFYAERNSGQIIIQTGKWYYKLDHSTRTVYIIDLARFRSKVLGGKVSSDAGLCLVPDSLLEKYGRIDIKKASQMLKIRISFAPDVLVRDIYMEYDTRKNIPLLYQVKMKVLYGIDGWSYEERFMDQTLVASNFLFTADAKAGNTGEYFSYERGKIRLKKYADYKLIRQI